MLGRIFALLLIAVAVAVVASVYMPEASRKKIKSFFLSEEQRALFSACEGARQAFREQGLPGKSAQVDFMIRDQRLEKDPILSDLMKCFVDLTKKQTAYRFEVELFCSDFAQESSADLQVQVSAFDTKTKNKVAEAGFRIDHQPYQDSTPAASAPPAPGENNSSAKGTSSSATAAPPPITK